MVQKIGFSETEFFQNSVTASVTLTAPNDHVAFGWWKPDPFRGRTGASRE
ncbi:hypothetical protein KBY27_21300 [Ruegeria pomeroyi]|uniref:Uncharacterized protein n=1 Tax=Ruegeria pomeroyi TaxID=89184 RepID=A0A9Q3WPL8_9RHOB|nr:hypothetical protein [Ruegeria pomeroyi]MCE8540006.1 hypothetical protein [Ruegeria pomeroyi]